MKGDTAVRPGRRRMLFLAPHSRGSSVVLTDSDVRSSMPTSDAVTGHIRGKERLMLGYYWNVLDRIPA